MTPDEVGVLLKIPFTAQQCEAIGADAHSPVQIVAGAGSGKTAVMAGRVVWLVANGHARPDQVLGLTFTNKAAGELAERIRTALTALAALTAQNARTTGTARKDPGPTGPTGPTAAAGHVSGAVGAVGAVGADAGLEPTVTTYHAFAGALVRDNGLRVGVEPDARLLTDAVRFQLAGSVLRAYAGPLPTLDRSPTAILGALVDLESQMSDHLADPADVRAWALQLAPHLDAQADLLAVLPKTKGRVKLLREAAVAARMRADLCLLVDAYRQAKRDADAVDFGDQITTAVRIGTECPEVAAVLRDRYRVVLLDEYQDTSAAQRMLLVALFGQAHGVTAVGDPCQAIYGWRGASVDNLARFPDHYGVPGKPALQLTQSQRSGGLLLAAANEISDPLRSDYAVQRLVARAGAETAGRLTVARHERFAEELAWIAAQVGAELAGGTPPGEIAVLLRAWRNAGPVYAALTAADIPVEVVGLGGLLALPEVSDVVATLSLLDDPTANASLVRLLAGPRWMLDARDLRALGDRAQRLLGSPHEMELDPLEEAAGGVDPCDVVALADALDDPGTKISAEGARRLRALGGELRRLRRHVGDPLLDLVSRVITTTGLDVEVAASPAAVGARRRESLAMFADVVGGYVGIDGTASLHGFLAYLRAADDYDRGFDSAVPADTDAVQLMTVHKAKGLEWDVVVVPDLNHDTFPNRRMGDNWPKTYSLLPHRHRKDRDSLAAEPDFTAKEWAKEFDEASKRLHYLDEDRLAYVAMTRARRHVIASSSVWGPTQRRPRTVSRYLTLLREHAEHGAGSVECWASNPEDSQARNPYLTVGEYVWPVALEPSALALRQSAAAAVLGALTDPAGTLVGADADASLSAQDRSELAALDAEAGALLAEAAAGRASEIEVPLPVALTASQVLTLRSDPDELARMLARPLPQRPVRAARRGTAFHGWVEARFSLRPLLDPDELPGAADEGVVDDAELAELQQAFLATEWAEREPFAIEAPFAVLIGGHVVRGRIDAVYDLGPQSTPRWQVIDWKTGRETADPWQLAVYRLAWAQLQQCRPDQVDAGFLTVRTGTLERPTLPDEATLTAVLSGAVT